MDDCYELDSLLAKQSDVYDPNQKEEKEVHTLQLMGLLLLSNLMWLFSTLYFQVAMDVKTR